MDWSKPLPPVCDIYSLYLAMCRYEKVSRESYGKLMEDIGYAPPSFIERSLRLLGEMHLLSSSLGVYEVTSDKLDMASFSNVLKSYIKSMLQHEPWAEELLPLEGLYEVTNDGELKYWKSYVNKKYIALLPLFEFSGLLSIEETTRSIVILNTSELAKRFTDIPQETISRLNLKHLLDDLERKRALGIKGEKAAFEYECILLGKNGDSRKPNLLTDIYVNAGYDIESFQTKESEIADKFIEVKTISAANHFFMSRNEVLVAKSKGENYFLYLVNLSSGKANIEIIQNPYNKLIHAADSDWLRSISSYRFEKID